MVKIRLRGALILTMMSNFFSYALSSINMNYSGVYAAEKLKLKPYQFGLASSISTLVTQLFQPLWGYVSDLKGIRKYFISLGFLVMGLAISFTFKLQNYVQYLIVNSLAWMSWNGAYVCWQALIGDLTSISGRGKFVGALGFAGNLGSIISSAIAGQAIDLYGYDFLFILCIIFTFMSSMLILPIKEERISKRIIRRDDWRRAISREFKLYLIVSMGWWGIMSMAWPLFSITQVKVYHLTKTEIGILALALSIPSTIMSPIWGGLADRIGRKPLLIISPIFASLWTLAYSITESFTQILLLTLIGSIGGSALMTVSTIYLLDTIKYREHRATLISIYGFMTGITKAIGQLLGGYLGGIIGLKETMLLASILRLAYSIPMIILPETKLKHHDSSKIAI